MRAHVTAAFGAILILGASLLLAQSVLPGQVSGTSVGPSTMRTPYVAPTAPGWETKSLITAGESAQAAFYPMAGIPDGLGALAGRLNGNGKHVADPAFMTVFMNHEIPSGSGGVRAHGQRGAFVSQWGIYLNTLEVKFGEDFIREVWLWDSLNHQYYFGNTVAGGQFSRFCSADLPAADAFFNATTQRGFDGRLFLNGEESGNEGRAFAHVITGDERGRAYQLPSLGRMSYENSVAHPNAGDTTLVVNLDDSTPGQVYVYVGSKRKAGNPVERAGLAGGSLYGIRVTNGGANYGNGATPFESAGVIAGTFSLVNVTDVATGTGAVLQTTSRARGVTEFARPKDGAWDTKSPNVFYFVTTGASVHGRTQTARLYELTFDNVAAPTGGTISLVVDAATLTGTDGQTSRSFDNITVDGDGHVIVQEDPGNTNYIAKTWRISPSGVPTAVQILEADRFRFIAGAPQFLTQDEESSGVIEVTDIVKSAHWYEKGRRYYLAVIQAHYPVAGAQFEGGQLYLIASPRTR